MAASSGRTVGEAAGVDVVGDVGGGDLGGEDFFFVVVAEALGDAAVDFPGAEVGAAGDGPLGFFGDDPVGVGFTEGHDAADDATAVGADGVDGEADAFGFCVHGGQGRLRKKKSMRSG